MHLDAWLSTPIGKESESNLTCEDADWSVASLWKARSLVGGPEKRRRNASMRQPTLKAAKSAGNR